jgi:NAD(P) transhydrogenase subunit alpha
MSDTMVGIYVFVLSCIIGYHVIWNVTPALHTPLMAVTNAISGIVIVGAIIVAGAATGEPVFVGLSWTQVIGFTAIFLASINIFGGFVVTNRILAMFKKKNVNK